MNVLFKDVISLGKKPSDTFPWESSGMMIKFCQDCNTIIESRILQHFSWYLEQPHSLDRLAEVFCHMEGFAGGTEHRDLHPSVGYCVRAMTSEGGHGPGILL